MNGASAGIFPAGSAIRHIGAEPPIYLGAGRALLLQLAHPQIARAVSEHSRFGRESLARLAETLTFIAVVVFGTRAEAGQVIARVRQIHTHVAGSGYDATDPALQTWVNATLVDTALLCYARAYGPVPPGLAEGYYRDAVRVGELLGVPPGTAPPDYVAFRCYVTGMTDTLRVSGTGRRLGHGVLRGDGLPTLLRPALPAFRLVTTGLLPEPIRSQYGLPWSAVQDRMLSTALRGGGLASTAIPGRLRRSGPATVLAVSRVVHGG
jgi:uncharacterized protein (DUF2236 family)